MFTIEEEDKLWESGVLGSHSPQVLLNTMIFLFGINFAFRSGKEHRTLTIDQLHFGSNDAGEFLVYRENISKNHPGGIRSRQIESKIV